MGNPCSNFQMNLFKLSNFETLKLSNFSFISASLVHLHRLDIVIELKGLSHSNDTDVILQLLKVKVSIGFHGLNVTFLMSTFQIQPVSSSHNRVKESNLAINTMSSTDDLSLIDDTSTTNMLTKLTEGYLPRISMRFSFMTSNDSTLSNISKSNLRKTFRLSQGHGSQTKDKESNLHDDALSGKQSKVKEFAVPM